MINQKKKLSPETWVAFRNCGRSSYGTAGSAINYAVGTASAGSALTPFETTEEKIDDENCRLRHRPLLLVTDDEKRGVRPGCLGGLE